VRPAANKVYFKVKAVVRQALDNRIGPIYRYPNTYAGGVEYSNRATTANRPRMIQRLPTSDGLALDKALRSGGWEDI
jgi:hypothetical protein